MKTLLTCLLLSTAPVLAADPSPEEVRFTSHGIELAGSIVLPAGEIRAGVVFVHGSGKQERNLHWARRFADAGIAALVYDKRGAGASGGEYEGNQSVSEQNLVLLADDAASGLERLSRHSSLQGKPLGFAGISQAGWIVPLAIERSPLAKFLVLWSGPVCKVSEEDIYSKFTADRAGRFAPPYERALAARSVPYVWPDFLGKDSNPADSLRKRPLPGLWIFSDNDTSVPVDLSIARLNALREPGLPFEYALFSGLGHDNMEATFTVATDWIRQRK